jgi:hypothetical protein
MNKKPDIQLVKNNYEPGFLILARLIAREIIIRRKHRLSKLEQEGGTDGADISHAKRS